MCVCVCGGEALKQIPLTWHNIWKQNNIYILLINTPPQESGNICWQKKGQDTQLQITTTRADFTYFG